ncbi:MAG: sporulation protein [Candidatus Marinimicrobia bacterium]|nr:sporulation protein [Candidatus Neomarinimicrobiota bacterium]
MVEELVEKMLTNLKSIVESETVIGHPVESGETTIIPLTKISLGFGAGGGQSKAEQEGEASATGGGANIEPVAVITIQGDDVKVINLKKGSTDYSKFINMIPKIVDKFSKKGEDKEKKNKE